MARVKVITQQDYDAVKERAEAALEILEGERFSFFKEYLDKVLADIEYKILNNTITEARETHSITDRIIKTFIRPKKEQVDEMVGQYKAVKKIFSDLQDVVETKNDLDREIEAERVKVHEEKV